MAQQFSVMDGKPWKAAFYSVWGGQVLSILGTQLVQFSLTWYLTIQTGSAMVLSIASLVGLLPSIILGPFIGALVDRWNHRLTMIIADALTALATVVLALWVAAGEVEINRIYIILFVRSIASVFHHNAMSSSTSLMVPTEHLTRIQGLNQMVDGGLNILAAPLGAFLLTNLPLQWILFMDAFTALVAILPLLFICIPEPKVTKSDETFLRVIWKDFMAGLKYVIASPGLRMVGLLTLLINFTIIPAFTLLPLLIKDQLGGDAIQLSWVEAAMGIGMILGGASLSVWGGFKRKIVTSLIGLIGMGIGVLILALTSSSTIFLAVAGALMVGVMTPITMGPFTAIIQSHVEPNMQAKLFTLMSSLGTAIVPLGMVVAGPISDRFGIKVWFGAGGLLCVVMALVGLSLPTVINIESAFKKNPEL